MAKGFQAGGVVKTQSGGLNVDYMPRMGPDEREERKPLVTEEDMNRTLRELQEQVRRQQEEDARRAADVDHNDWSRWSKPSTGAGSDPNNRLGSDKIISVTGSEGERRVKGKAA